MRKLFILFFFGFVAIASAREAILVDKVIKLWDKGHHNAFTDLTRFKGRWFCCFREAEAHVCTSADIRILSSKNGRDWEPASVIGMKGHDLRDPKLSVSPNGKWLEVLMGDTLREGSKPASFTRNFLVRSRDGVTWNSAEYVGPEQEWLWRITWHKKVAYGVAYDVHPDIRAAHTFFTRLYFSDDGNKFNQLANPLCDKVGSNEATIRFDAKKNIAYVLQRRDGPNGQNSAFLGTSKAPYKEWTWQDLGQYFGGPNFIQIPDGRWIAVGRLLMPDEKGKRVPRTVVCELDVKKPELRPLLTLPSGGDNSYAGLYWYDSMLWISYYSSHEDNQTSIYLARVKIPKIKR